MAIFDLVVYALFRTRGQPADRPRFELDKTTLYLCRTYFFSRLVEVSPNNSAPTQASIEWHVPGADLLTIDWCCCWCFRALLWPHQQGVNRQTRFVKVTL